MDNFGPFITPLIRRWKWLALAAFSAAVLAWLINMLLPPSYEATIPVAIIRAQTQVILEGSVESTLVSDDRVIDARRSAFVALVKNSDVADRVRRKASETLSLEISVNQLLNMVVANSNGDLINISVTYGEIDVARQLAAIWAEEYVVYINELYSLDSETDLQQIRSQTAVVEQNYLSMQNALEAFLFENDMSRLQREVDATILLVSSYEEARRATLITPIDLEVMNNRLILETLYSELVELETVLASAAAIETSIEASGTLEISSPGAALRLLSLENQIFGGDNPAAMLIDPTSDSLNTLTLSNVQDFIDVLEVKRDIVLGQIESLSSLTSLPLDGSASTGSAFDAIISDLETELRTLQVQLEAESSQLQMLQAERDAALATLQTMRGAQLEAELQAQTPRIEVKRATVGIPPAYKAGLTTRTLVVLAAVFGLCSAIVFVLVQDMYLKSRVPVNE